MRNFYLLIALLFFTQFSFAQQTIYPGLNRDAQGSAGANFTATTGASGTGSNIDVTKYDIYWRLNPDSTTIAIKGEVTTYFKTTSPGVASLQFDLNSDMSIDGVTFHGTAISVASVTRSGNKFTIPLPSAIATTGTADQITVKYSGTPTQHTGNTILGFRKAADVQGNNYYYTLAESFEDKDFWPCKADMQDKPDEMDIAVSVPWKQSSTTDTFWVATIGKLYDSTITGDSRTFRFHVNYPVASYLVSVCVGRFKRYYQGTVDGNGTNVPVVYYLSSATTAKRTAATYTSIVAGMDKVTELVTLFGNKFGPYPFPNDKHGFYEGLGTFGGMEHQGFSGISTSSITNREILAHELSHQWFGDKVTFSTWSDLWLAEGFAAFCESLAAELLGSSAMGYTALSSRQDRKGEALGFTTTSAYIPPASATTTTAIWGSNYGSTVYCRGAMVVQMLRALAGDTKFFQALKNYMADPALAYKSATTENLRDHFNAVLGLSAPYDLTKFFEQNVKGTGHPKYQIGYQITGKKIAFTIASVTKTTSSTVTDTFQQPIFVHIKGSAGQDTSVVFYTWGGNRYSTAGGAAGLSSAIKRGGIAYDLSFVPVGSTLAFDDSSKTMSEAAATAFVSMTVVDLKEMEFNARPHSNYNETYLVLDDNSINSTIILERSADGVAFTALGNMVLQAGTGTEKKYVFNDTDPLKADNYYRAKYKNAAGTYIYTKIVKLGGLKGQGFSVLNNPVKDLLQVKNDAAYLNKNVVYSVYDAGSRLIMVKQVKNTGSITDIDASHLAPGVYLIKINTGEEEQQAVKFIKH